MDTYNYPYKNATEAQKLAVWQKGTPIPGEDAELWRSDSCGHKMYFPDHGNTETLNGWEIDHIFPASKGGSDALDNLQPLYWENNRRKGDTTPWYCENAA